MKQTEGLRCDISRPFSPGATVMVVALLVHTKARAPLSLLGSDDGHYVGK